MKKNIAALLLMASVTVEAQLSPVITSWIQNPDTNLAVNRTTVPISSGSSTTHTIPSNCLKVQYSATDVYVSCTCIPGYSIGPWNANPNVPVNENFVYKFTLSPRKNTGTLTTIGNGHIGVWSNGVSMFNADDAQYVNTIWSRNAYFFEGNSFDNCLGHPAPNGEYHHHVNPTCLYNDADSTHHSPIIGYMFDGYPIYGAYAYADTAGGGVIKRMRSSYRLRTDSSRTTKPDGTAASTAGPAVSSTYPMGCLLWDYEYVAGYGDLDSRNGRFCITPEYPQGTYAYFVTIDNSRKPVFPYTPYQTYYGVVQPGNGGGPSGGHNTITGTTTVYVDTVAASTGVNTLNQQITFKLLPNPTLGYVYIYMDNNSTNNVAAKLYNEQGHLLQDIGYMQPTIAYSIDLTKYPTGIYLLHMNDGKQELVRKIVKQ
jgi:YHYH protein/Secretion system C-terminal sorting domain